MARSVFRRLVRSGMEARDDHVRRAVQERKDGLVHGCEGRDMILWLYASRSMVSLKP
jgi:hypothetical protein